MNGQRVRAFTGIIVAATLGLSGCSGGSAKEPGAAKAGGTITYGVAGGGLTQLDPNKVASAALLPLTSLLYDGLTTYGPDMTVKPALATSWSASDDQKTWTFKLRTGVKFHDGREFTADDAVKNIERVLDPKTGSQAKARLSMVTEVTAEDPATLKIKLDKPNALLPMALIQVKMSDVPTIADVNKNANGTGPYKLKAFVPDDHVDLVRNDAYWGPRGKLDGIKVVNAADPTAAITSLRNKELDVVWNVPPLDATELRADPELSLLKPVTFSGSVMWEVDTTSAPFKDVRARQALAYALNRAQLLTAGYDGNGVAADANGILNPKQPGYAATQQRYDQDLNKAKQLFTEAGVKPGTKLVFWTTAGRNPQWVTMAEILQQDLAKIGLQLDIQKNEVSTWLQKFFPAGKKYPGTIVANYLSSPVEPSQQLNFFKTGICECNWSDKDYDELLAKAVGTADEAERTELYGRLQQILNEQVPVIVPLKTTQLTVVQKRLTGAWVQSDGTVHLEGAGLGG
jgi:peptide/nickel transport system substrate-binding protein